MTSVSAILLWLSVTYSVYRHICAYFTYTNNWEVSILSKKKKKIQPGKSCPFECHLGFPNINGVRILYFWNIPVTVEDQVEWTVFMWRLIGTVIK